MITSPIRDTFQLPVTCSNQLGNNETTERNTTCDKVKLQVLLKAHVTCVDILSLIIETLFD